MAIATCYVTLVPTRDYHGKISNLKVGSVTMGKPGTITGDTVVLKLNLDIPDSAFDATVLDVKFKDNSAVKTTKVVADLQDMVADLSKSP